MDPGGLCSESYGLAVPSRKDCVEMQLLFAYPIPVCFSLKNETGALSTIFFFPVALFYIISVLRFLPSCRPHTEHFGYENKGLLALRSSRDKAQCVQQPG